MHQSYSCADFHQPHLFSNFSGASTANLDRAKQRLRGKTCCAWPWSRASTGRSHPEGVNATLGINYHNQVTLLQLVQDQKKTAKNICWFRSLIKWKSVKLLISGQGMRSPIPSDTQRTSSMMGISHHPMYPRCIVIIHNQTELVDCMYPYCLWLTYRTFTCIYIVYSTCIYMSVYIYIYMSKHILTQL